MRSTLVSEMLTKVDRLTMASGLEARVPFLDHHLVEWAFELPARLKMQGSEGKLLVKHALHSRLAERHHLPRQARLQRAARPLAAP